MKALNFLFFLSLLLFSQSLCALENQKDRVLVLTDIEGIVATTSCWKKTSIAPESIAKVIRA